jgi:phosphatidylserine decarboxylase
LINNRSNARRSALKVRKEVIPFLIASVVTGLVIGVVCMACGLSGLAGGMAGGAAALVMGLYMVYFFRDPERTPPGDASLVVAGAEGKLTGIREMREDECLKTDTIRLSIYLNPFNVHVNRAPLAGKVTYLGYKPGKRFLTIREKSSELNEHTKIVIEGERTRCLVKQICGPICRRVVYWLEDGQVLARGERIGMMKFGSRLDMFFPKEDIEVVAKEGDPVRAGETVVARLR